MTAEPGSTDAVRSCCVSIAPDPIMMSCRQLCS
jgi:hypothetical protein